jgi:hypothetical protein
MGRSWIRGFLTNWTLRELLDLPFALFIGGIMLAGPVLLIYGLGVAVYRIIT